MRRIDRARATPGPRLDAPDPDMAPVSIRAAVAVECRRAWDPRRLVTTEGNRWSGPGEPTIYLAGSAAVALAEFARHAPEDGPVTGSLWSVRVELRGVVDLTGEDVRMKVAVGGGRDRGHAYSRGLAGDARRSGAQAILVPSFPFLDRSTCRNLVVFADQLVTSLAELFGDAERIGSVRIAREVGSTHPRRDLAAPSYATGPPRPAELVNLRRVVASGARSGPKHAYGAGRSWRRCPAASDPSRGGSETR